MGRYAIFRWLGLLLNVECVAPVISGFVNEANQNQNNPTYEIFPGKNPANRTLVTLQFLTTTQPANLYPLTWWVQFGITLRSFAPMLINIYT